MSNGSRYRTVLAAFVVVLAILVRLSRSFPHRWDHIAHKKDALIVGRCFVEITSLFCDGRYRQVAFSESVRPCSDLKCIMQFCRVDSQPRFQATPQQEGGFLDFFHYSERSKCSRVLKMPLDEAREHIRARTGRACARRFSNLCGEPKPKVSLHGAHSNNLRSGTYKSVLPKVSLHGAHSNNLRSGTYKSVLPKRKIIHIWD